MPVGRRQVVPGYPEDVSPAGGGAFYQHLHIHNAMARCVLTALHMCRPGMQVSYADFAERQAGCRFPH